ncbi:MAG TPA: methionyl-tRNA formyltransferase [Terriglobia bacterium]|nr:methionyl-tRNA formyltransferase [Terriglobia bacterium]
MNLIFCGTPQFAVPTLEMLLGEGFGIEFVITNPDEPRGRGYELTASPVKQAAFQAGLRIFQPIRLKDAAVQAEMTRIKPDAIVVVAYGHIIPPWMIELSPLGCINLHASLLPRYRGAAPIPWAIIRGERATGVTTMKIDQGLDTGDILLHMETEITDTDTTETLSERLSRLGAPLMTETLRKLERGEIQPQPQNHAAATLAPMLKKEDGRLHWSSTAEEISRRVRGLRPWPVAHTKFVGQILRIWMARPATISLSRSLQPGELQSRDGRLFVGCSGKTALELTELQLEGRKRLSARDFVNGVRIAEGEKLGE